MSNLAVRILSAVVLGVVGFSALVLDVRSRWAIVALALALGAWEFSRMISAKFSGPRVAALTAVLTLICVLPHYPGIHLPFAVHWTELIIVVAFLGLTLIGFRYVDISGLAPWLYLQIFSVAYFGIYAAALFGLLRSESGWSGIFPLLLTQAAIAMADTGAYATGRAFGKHKLCPSISSGKTIEGAIGGAILTTALVAWIGPKCVGGGLLSNIGLGVVLSITAILGDLFISILKRYTGTKDSSHLIPGHGGVLDRFDSLFFSAPAALLYLHLVQA